MPDADQSFMPMPGFTDPQSEEAFRQQQKELKDRERAAQIKQFRDQFIQQRGLDAQNLLQQIPTRQTSGSPVNLRVKADPTGVTGLGGTLSLPFSPRIGVTVGGSYATPQSMTQEIMGQNTQISSPGQFAGSVGYRSPFMNVDVEYSPNRGLSGFAGTRAAW